MDYVGNVIRPPSEADSIILQTTVGCSHNRCTFCGAYKDVRFRIKEEHIVDRDLRNASLLFPEKKKLFLADGDVLTISQKRLVRLLRKIQEELPNVSRVRLYGSAKSILSKTPSQLKELSTLGLDRIYMGLESGDDSVLERIGKWGNSDTMIAAAERAKAAAIFLSVTVLLGVAGEGLSREHAEKTAAALNRMAPNQIAALTLMLIPGTPLDNQKRDNKFSLPKPDGLLRELRTLIEGITLQRTQFQANHASNYLPINCRLIRDKEKVLQQIDLALAGRKPLMPEFMRGL
jgi:radical SAM superfamily enzyme YgiQ (UPF0313 family)